MTSFGKKDSSAWDYGKKAMGVVTKGVKLAGEVEGVAGEVGNLSMLAAGAAAASGVGIEFAPVFAGVAGAAKLVQAGAGEAKTMGKRIER
jgi:hypothetical protein